MISTTTVIHTTASWPKPSVYLWMIIKYKALQRVLRSEGFFLLLVNRFWRFLYHFVENFTLYKNDIHVLLEFSRVFELFEKPWKSQIATLSGSEEAFAIERKVSRLSEMSSEQYWAEVKENRKKIE